MRRILLSLVLGVSLVGLLWASLTLANAHRPDASLPQNRYTFSASPYHCDEDAVLYTGNVRADGLPLLEAIDVTYYDSQGIAQGSVRYQYDLTTYPADFTGAVLLADVRGAAAAELLFDLGQDETGARLFDCYTWNQDALSFSPDEMYRAPGGELPGAAVLLYQEDALHYPSAVQIADAREEQLMQERVTVKKLDSRTVITMRDTQLTGLSNAQRQSIRNLIAEANRKLEYYWVYDDQFSKLRDSSSLTWNYFEQTGEIQVGWAFDGEIYAQRESLGLTQEEFEQQYGTPILANNPYCGADLLEKLREQRGWLADNALRDDYDRLIHAFEQAVENHDAEQLTEAYKILHDMDYYLLRYWGDLTEGIQDTSTLRTYYGALTVWQELSNAP